MELNFESDSSLSFVVLLSSFGSGLFSTWMFIGLGDLDDIFWFGLNVFIGEGGLFEIMSVFVSYSDSFSFSACTEGLGYLLIGDCSEVFWGDF